MQIKVFEEYKTGMLEESVNDFLDSIEPKREGASSRVVDIKYQTMWVVNPQSSSYEDNCATYSAMIIYK